MSFWTCKRCWHLQHEAHDTCQCRGPGGCTCGDPENKTQED